MDHQDFDDNGAELNPWRTMWLRPRATVRWLVANDPERHMLLLPALAGIHESLGQYMLQGRGDVTGWPGLVGMAIVLGPIFAILGMLIYCFLLRFTGQWLGGKASLRQLITAYAWSRVPVAYVLPVWIVAIGVLGQGMFTSQPLETFIGPLQVGLFLGFTLLVAAASIWTLVLLVMGVAEVQGFSAWRALGNLLLAVVVVVAVLMVVGAVIGIIAAMVM